MFGLYIGESTLAPIVFNSSNAYSVGMRGAQPMKGFILNKVYPVNRMEEMSGVQAIPRLRLLDHYVKSLMSPMQLKSSYQDNELQLFESYNVILILPMQNNYIRHCLKKYCLNLVILKTRHQRFCRSLSLQYQYDLMTSQNLLFCMGLTILLFTFIVCNMCPYISLSQMTL